MAESWDHLEDWEEWNPESGTSFIVHAAAGSVAGAAEHCAIFPFDTIKTHMQTEGSSVGSLRNLVRQDGFFRLWRGVSTMFTACIPAHAAYFSLFEQSKIYFGADQPGHHPLQAAASGAIATIAHDSIMTPMDVIKQRLQLGFHTGMVDCVQSIIKAEGVGALFLSFPTTLIMNIPYAGVMVAANESFKEILNPNNEYNLGAFFISGGMAGAVAAAVTTPLDVVKTRLQTQSIMLSSNPTPPRKVAWARSGSSFQKMWSQKFSGALSGSQVRYKNSVGQPTFGFSVSPYYSRACKFVGGKGTITAVTTQHKKKLVTLSKSHLEKQNNQAFLKGARPHSSTPSSSQIRYHGMVDAVKRIYHEEGIRGFTRGLRPRLMVHAPSVAISWTTYETAKNLFAQQV